MVRPPQSEVPKKTRTAASEKPKTSITRPNYRLIAALVVGISLAILTSALVVMNQSSDEDRRATVPATEESKKEALIAASDDALLNQIAPLCGRTISKFLDAGTPESRNQFVFAPVATASRMADFYKLNPLLSIDAGTLTLTRAAVLHLSKGDAIEVNYRSDDDLRLDAVFFNENGEWRLDWEHFARYGSHPWALFLAGGGNAEGEFRLLARQRLVDERKNHADISLVFYAPQQGHPEELGSHSPEFLVDRNSKNGRLLEAAFKLEKSGKRAFGVKFPSSDPEGIIRIRVKVRRVDGNDERHFELTDVVACHWYSTDELGMEIADP